MNVRTGLSYGDVLLVPQRSPVDSRDDVDLSVEMTDDLTLDVPLVSAPMDTVTEVETAKALSRAGGLGVIHRFLTVEEEATMVETVAETGERAAGAVGIAEDYLARTEALAAAGADCVVLDVAHGHMERALDAASEIDREFPDLDLIAGNVATPAGVEDLYTAGADCVKVGIGPGSHCTTRQVTGAGVPQLTAVDECADAAHDLGITIIADGGIQTSGDGAKALMAGADALMMGSFFGATREAPGEIVEIDGQRYRRTRGMSTTGANERRTDKEQAPDADEGVEALTPISGPLAEEVAEFAGGLRSALSYCGGHTVAAARENAEFIRVAAAAKEREGAHSVEALLESETGDVTDADSDAGTAD